MLDKKDGGVPEIGEHLAPMAKEIAVDDFRQEIEIVK